MSYNEITSTNEQVTANLFSDYSSSVYSTKNIDLDAKTLDIPTFDLPNNAAISVEDVFCRLSPLENIWSIDPDGLSGLWSFFIWIEIGYCLPALASF